MRATVLTQTRRADVPDAAARHLLMVLAHFADDAGDIPAGIVDGLCDGRLIMAVVPPSGPAGGQIVVRTAVGTIIAQIPLCEPLGRHALDRRSGGAGRRGVTP